MSTTETVRLSATESNRLLRKALKAAFPGVKFSVTGSRGTGYGYASVSWIDGPELDAVQAIIGRFEGSKFDGMQDMEISTPKAIGPNGELTGLRGISTTRGYSAEKLAEATRELVAEGYFGKYDGNMAGAARALLNGVPMHIVAQCHHLGREI